MTKAFTNVPSNKENKTKKVMHAVSVMNRAGQETFIMNLYRCIDRSKIQFGFQCTVPEKGDFDEEINKLGGEIYYLDKNEKKFILFKYLNEILLQYRFFRNHPDYQIFHIHTYHAFNAWLYIVGAKMAGVDKIILHSHNTFGLHPTLHLVFKVLLKYMKIERLACSQKAAEWMYGEKEILKGRVKIINNGIFPGQFRYDAEKGRQKRKELHLESNLIIGHIGRFMTQKNHVFLIEVFKEICKKQNNAVLLLIGMGELMAQIEGQVEKLGLKDNVCFLGVREDIKELLWAMDLFLFPSLHEGLSVVAIEAQAAGVPMLAADTLTSETKITQCLQFLSLNENKEKWASEALKAAERGHADTKEQIVAAGYDMEKVTEVMQGIYE